MYLSGGNIVVSVYSCDLLCNVVHTSDVSAEGGNCDAISVHTKIKRGKDILHLVLGDIHSKELVYSLDLKGKNYVLSLCGVHVDNSVNDLSRAEHLNKLASALKSAAAVFGIKSLLKSCRAFGSHTVFLRGNADRRPEEASGLKYNGGGVILYLAVCAAHNSSEGNRFSLVCDNEHRGVKGVILIVKGSEKLVFFSAANVYGRAAKAAIVKGVHRLTVLKHNVVGYINDVVDRANAACAESHTQPEGRGLDFYVLDHSCHISVAKVGGGYLNGKVIVYLISVAEGLDLGGMELQLASEGHRALTRKSDNGKTVGAIGGYLKLYHGVLQHKNVADVLAYLGSVALVENEYTIGLFAGHIVLVELELTHRAEHTVRLNASELT